MRIDLQSTQKLISSAQELLQEIRKYSAPTPKKPTPKDRFTPKAPVKPPVLKRPKIPAPKAPTPKDRFTPKAPVKPPVLKRPKVTPKKPVIGDSPGGPAEVVAFKSPGKPDSWLPWVAAAGLALLWLKR